MLRAVAEPRLELGSSATQTGAALGHRGWNRQPDGGAIGDGTSPARMIRSPLVGLVRVGDGHRGQQRAGVGVTRAA